MRCAVARALVDCAAQADSRLLAVLCTWCVVAVVRAGIFRMVRRGKVYRIRTAAALSMCVRGAAGMDWEGIFRRVLREARANWSAFGRTRDAICRESVCSRSQRECGLLDPSGSQRGGRIREIAPSAY